MKYIYLYQNENEYNADSTRVLPAVSYCQSEESVFYAPYDGSYPDPDEPVHPSDEYITFADPVVEQIITDAYGTNGKITYGQAAAVTEFMSGDEFETVNGYHITRINKFYENKNVQYFDEFKYFTGLTSIGDRTFYKCENLKHITLPPNITSIGIAAFYDDSSLEDIDFPDSITTIGYGAFDHCTSFTNEIRLPNSLTTIGGRCFYGCTNLKKIIFNNYLETIGDEAFWCCWELTGEINLPSTLTYIGVSAFRQCKKITKITLPNTLTTIKECAFEQCISLESINIPNSLQYFGVRAFSWCELLTLGNVSIPNTVTYLGAGAFHNCYGLTEIFIPSSVTTIGQNGGEQSPFTGCKNLASIVIDENNPNYDSRNNCNAIIRKSDNTLIGGCKNSVIPEGVTTIEQGAFSGCSELTNITIPTTVSKIKWSSFSGCSGLLTLTLLPLEPPTFSYQDLQDSTQCIIYVPAESVDAYKAVSGWLQYADRIFPITE